MVVNDGLTFEEFKLFKSFLLREFDREVDKKINIQFFNQILNLDDNIKEGKNKEVEIDNLRITVKEKCGLKLYAEIFKFYSDYNSYARYTPVCIERITSILSNNSWVTEIFLNVAHEVGVILSTDSKNIEKLNNILREGYFLLTVNPNDENSCIIDKNILATIYSSKDTIDNFLKNNFLYIIIVLIFSYFDESEFYRKYNECYKGKK